MPKKSTMGGDEDIMELLWHNGQVVMQSQNQRSVTNKKQETIRSSVGEEDTRPAASGMFMQEEEMSPWLHYPIDDDNPLENYLYDHDTIYPSPTPAVTAPASSSPITAAAVSLPPPPPPSVVIPSRPPVPPYRRSEVDSVQPKNTNFSHFTRPNKIRIPELGSESCLHNCNKIPPVLQSATTVGSNVAQTVTPAVNVSESRVSRVSEKRSSVGGGGGAGGTSSAGREMETCEVSMTSSPGSGGSGASGSMEPMCQKLPAVTDDRKRKGVDADDNDCHIEVNP
ncbi:hypothetical protein QVD17_15476 [Tagetes erecta]|uniref:Uncharacterized protein n=1 Tax=Tagetes erecta TaxID=13708 RepID=A0AAD8NZP3_TARER|nr:hypothetical protein QVD17_15476 [Tagetes erecta]